MLIKLLLFQCSNKGLNQGDTLPRLLRGVHEKSMVTVLLEFRGLFTERPANALTKLQVCSSPGRIKIGEAFSAKVCHLCKKFLELSNATGKVFNRGHFGPHARRF